MITETVYLFVLYVHLFAFVILCHQVWSNSDTDKSDFTYTVNLTQVHYDDNRTHTALNGMDLLLPYGFTHHGPHHHHRFVRDCQNIKYGNVTHSLLKTQLDQEVKLPIISTRTIIVTNENEAFTKQTLHGHYHVINSPLETVSVMEPLHDGTCVRTPAFRARVHDTAASRQCLLAVNAGFFNIETGACLGNIVSDGRLAQDNGGIQNAHFGILQNGSLFFGFLSQADLTEANFKQLVGGVIWLIRDGEVYINESQQLECSDTQMSGNLEYFINVQSARSAVGHDRDGKLVIVQIDGKTLERGMNLWELATLLLDLGVVNAINLDGGGSVTTVMNGTLVNYPSDLCTDARFVCERAVSTILCVHEPECSPLDCSGNGRCIVGHCECAGQWTGETCDQLACNQNCNDHGRCTTGGCLCDLGWLGETCNTSCSQGWYGLKCSQRCACDHSKWCSPVDGSCVCLPGYTGRLCDRECAHGLYGANCSKPCYCSGGCSCDHITGSCQMSLNGTALLQAATCIAEKRIHDEHLVIDHPEQFWYWTVSVLSVSLFAALSLVINIILICQRRRSQSVSTKRGYQKARLLQQKAMAARRLISDDSSDDESSEYEDIKMEKMKFLRNKPRS